MPRNTGSFFKVTVLIYSIIWQYGLSYSSLSLLPHVTHTPVPQQFSLLQPLFQLGCFSNYIKGLRQLKRKRTKDMKGRVRKTVASAQLKKELYRGENLGEEMGSGERREDLWLELAHSISCFETQRFCCCFCGFWSLSSSCPYSQSWNQLQSQTLYLWSASVTSP